MAIRNRLAVLACVLLFVSAAIPLSLGSYLLAALAAFALLAGYATDRLAPTAAYVLGAGLATLVLLAYADVHAFGYAESALERRAIPKSQSTSRTTIER